MSWLVFLVCGNLLCLVDIAWFPVGEVVGPTVFVVLGNYFCLLLVRFVLCSLHKVDPPFWEGDPHQSLCLASFEASYNAGDAIDGRRNRMVGLTSRPSTVQNVLGQAVIVNLCDRLRRMLAGMVLEPPLLHLMGVK